MSPRPATPRSAETEALRIVFFGAPRSGKSALLSAFERIASADAEEEPLQLKVETHGPGAPREIIPRIVLVDLPDAETARAVLLVDCDGEASGKLLNQPDPLKRSRVRGELADAIRNADALILVIEAAATEWEIEAHFEAFETFLGALREGRTFGRDVAGWPIFLTLTKCDELAEPGESVRSWLDRVEAESERLRAKFEAHFPDAAVGADDFFTFGSLNLAMEVTSTGVPAELRDNAYGTEEGTLNLDKLVREVLDAAGAFRYRARAARRRLKWTASGVVALLATMLLLMLGLFTAGEPTPLEKLTVRVQTLQTQDESPANRLAEKNIALRKAELEKIEQSREFDHLPPALQQFVRSRLREIDAYSAYKLEFIPPQFAPADVRTLGMYQRLQSELDTKLAPPAEYAETWNDTEAVRLRAKWREDLRLLEEYEDRVHNWYRRLIAEATELVVNPQQAGWRPQIGRLIGDANAPPFAVSGSPDSLAAQPVPGSQALPMPRGEALTFGDVFRYERADFAKRDWELAERRLLDLRDLTDAIGLTSDPDRTLETGEPAALLILPEPNGNRADSLALASTRLEYLKKRFPRAAAGTANWQTATFPDPLRQELSRRLTLAAETGQRHVRLLIDGELKLENGRADTPADWRKLVDSPTALLHRPELQAWGRLLQLLQSWSNPVRGEADPVAELAEFLKRDRHSIPLSAVEIYLPNSLRVQVLTPDGGVQLTVTPETGAARVLTLKLSPEVKSDANGVIYRFVPAIPLTPLEYRPGERFDAELPLKAGAAKYLLRWNRSRTEAFAFERLLLDPDLERLQPVEKPQRAPGVRVKILPEKAGGFVPELLPALRGIN